MRDVELQVEAWKKKLLDLGKRNRLLNFRETKRSNLNIITPSSSEVFDALVAEERVLRFSYPIEADMIRDYNMFDAEERIPEREIRTVPGYFTTNQGIMEQQKTLKSLRNKAKTAIEEQGVNVLYLAFGFLTWKETVGSNFSFCSPIVLVPVTLTIESLTSPYKLSLHDDEIVLNPTLKYKMEHDFNVVFPDFDADTDTISDYLEKIKTVLADYNWIVEDKVSLSIFSFLKINMYMDLDRRADAVLDNFAVKALCGDSSELPVVSSDLTDYDHDKSDRPIDIFQTVDADSSQQDAIELSKRGNSFVLQGPPGTGKSQTITNIISEALADGKKVLFVSEKMAALDVVYRRLSNVGLADFCLTLHNHKANKKEILQNLGDTLQLNRIKIRDEALYELEVLQQERQALNAYAQELHTVVMPMDKSIYHVNGILAKLKDMPNLIFDFDGITSVSAGQMRQYEYLLDCFAKTIGLLSEDYSDNVWKGSHVPHVTHELRQQIEVRANGISTSLQRFLQEAAECMDALDLDKAVTYQQVVFLSECLPLCAKAPRIPKEWFTRDDMKSMVDMVRTYSARQQEFVSTREWIDGYYTPEIYTVNALKKRATLSFIHANVKMNPELYPDNESVYNGIEVLIEACTQGLAVLHELEGEVSAVTEPYKLEVCQTLGEIHAYLPILVELNKTIRGTNLWFDQESLSGAVVLCQELSSLQASLIHNRQALLSTYEEGILAIDYEGILNRFKTEYTNIFKVFKSTYKSDLNQLRINAIIPMKKVTDDEVIRVLTAIKAIKEEEDAFQSKAQGAVDLLGDLFTGEPTDFTVILDQLNSCRVIMEHTGFHASNALRRLILSGENTGMFTDSIAKITELLSSPVLHNTFEIAQLSPTGSVQESVAILTTLKGQIMELQREYGEITAQTTETISFPQMEETITKLCLIQDIKAELARNETTLKETFLFLFDGTETNWVEIRGSLTWLGEFMPYIEKLGLKEGFIDHAISLQYQQDIQLLIQWVERLKRDTESDFTWFNTLYEEGYQLWELPLSNAINKLYRCTQNLHGLEQWNDFNNAIEGCRDNQLGQVVDVVLEEKVRPELVVSGFKKRFYKLWLDAVIPSYPAVSRFRRQSHEDMILQFKEHDIKQMNIAKARVRANLISKLPDPNKITSAKDEMGILNRELAKQRRIMPIRKLFANIPNLLPALKPCLMMSPLSVSLFLDSDHYQFDMVIFDEASQVCTENAIGAIMRGKQIIVAGDNKQLPPTNFFNATTTDGDYDVEGEEEDWDNYESILDEMLTAFPERSLKWHYRSKNEELITFSNVKIYNQSLITFPSSSESLPNNGVEYVYVPDGIYDRGGKKNNINEAKRVAELVFEHFKQSPKRSIGVIAFSGSQQQAIDDEITKMRLANPMFESFFDEERDEPFFVKNLENVQGDERDTILFSIGYAKDSRGVMYMNFGPLSRDGGYRRLNVAITRAKYNVKLVGSIQPTDIKSDVNAEGVKMLRSYIEFAIRGKVALENELRYDRFVDVDSPFEEAVYDFLVSKGYRVTTQVGCSGYRIDMAVKHPTLDGRFVIGVECDGATYHSSRTARERDRLRQTVLEDMGWRFHRIWSTDWIKDPITEGELLVEAVEKAIATYVDGFEVEMVPSVEVQEGQEEYFEADESATEAEPAGAIKFETYVEADARAARLGDLGLLGIKRAILKTVELEYPVHYEVLCRRIAPIFGNQKATVKIRNQVDYALQKMGEDVVRKGDFFYPSGSPEIKPKAPASGESPRAINHISDDEIGVAMVWIASDSYGLPKQNLFQITAKELGFNRTGANITSAFERVFEGLVETGELEYVEGKVRVRD